MSNYSDNKKKSSGSGSRNQQPKIVEDTPTMMSVSMMVAPPPVPLRSSPMVRPSKAAPTTISPHLNVKPIQKSNTASSTPWKVSKPLTMPSYYQLERTHVYVPPSLTSMDVSERIANFLRDESIAATFDSKQALAKAETSGNLKFAIRIWDVKGRGIAVEVQRMSGCSFLYHQTARALMQAAKNTGRASSSASKATPSVSLSSKPLPVPRCVPELPDAAWEECSREGMEIACHSLQHTNKMDAHLLALESLKKLTEASTKCRKFCAKYILSQENDILSTLVTLIQCSRLNAEQEQEECLTEFDQEHFALMHRHALAILANCLDALSEEEYGDVHKIVSDLPELTDDTTLKVLVDDVHQTCPHAATSACRCLQVLCRAMEQVPNKLLEYNCFTYVSSTADTCRHKWLQEECTKLMQQL